MTFDKKLLIIFNPVSGKNAEGKRQLIIDSLDSSHVQYDFYETAGPQDAWKKAQEFEIDFYDALVAVGGDGTIHEVVNGLLMRPDGRKIPVGFLPNGSGDDCCGNLGLDTGDIQTALKFILAGQTIKIDAVRALLDYDTREELETACEADPSIDFAKHLRYSITNSGLCLSANIARNAKWLKPYIGGAAYDVQALIELAKPKHVCYDIEVDEGSLNSTKEEGMVAWKQNLAVTFLNIYNGKYGGGRMNLSPTSLLNDGYFNLCVYNQQLGPLTANYLFTKVKRGGIHIYEDLI